jgi:hypothetical protein
MAAEMARLKQVADEAQSQLIKAEQALRAAEQRAATERERAAQYREAAVVASASLDAADGLEKMRAALRRAEEMWDATEARQDWTEHEKSALVQRYEDSEAHEDMSASVPKAAARSLAGDSTIRADQVAESDMAAVRSELQHVAMKLQEANDEIAGFRAKIALLEVT